MIIFYKHNIHSLLSRFESKTVYNEAFLTMSIFVDCLNLFINNVNKNQILQELFINFKIA